MILLKDFLKKIDGQILTQKVDISNTKIKDGYVSDLLSDVMGNAKEGQVWITIMRHLNVVAVASLANLSAVVFAKNYKPEKAVIDKANEEGICLISTSLPTFEVTGILYEMLKKTR
ncbi:MAG: DRTGG domain-containing protein [Candidatus Cloacimonadota bacterium]|nr:DRTGG domain-containing protein [Candidatus Cloacimonadota bacterium]